jgi:hypothetical protein
VRLFGEAQSRIVVSIAPSDAEVFEASAAAAGVPCARLGEAGGDRLIIGPLDVGLGEARAAWSGGLADALAGAA